MMFYLNVIRLARGWIGLQHPLPNFVWFKGELQEAVASENDVNFEIRIGGNFAVVKHVHSSVA